jgi:hypothetical protein
MLTSPPYEKLYKYDISFSNLELNVELRLYQRGLDPDSSLAQFWKASIENIWDNKFDIIDRDFHYHINFTVVFCGQLTSSVHSQVNWSASDSTRDIAHDVGNLIGLYDEYDGILINPSDPIYDSTSIMSDIGYNVYNRHYQAFFDWVKPYADGRRLFLAEYDADWVNPTIPEPATVFLFGLGLLLYRKNAKR